MKKIAHVLDDVALGGVTQLLKSLTACLADDFAHQSCVATTRFAIAPRIDADVIVVHLTMGWSKLPFLISLRQRNPKARLILVEHSYTRSFEAACVPSPWRFRLMLRLAYSVPEKIVAVSEGQARWITEAGLALPERVVVIPCVVDLSRFTAIPAPVHEPGAPLRLGAFGRYHRQKGFDTLIAAMRLVPARIARLEIAGYGEDEMALRQAADGLAHVTIGDRADAVAFLSRVDAVVMPSRWEAGAVSCWELRAAGRPAIVAAVDGLPEQVPPSIGHVVPPDNPQALAAAIHALAGADLQTMSAHARQSTHGAFTRVLRAWRDLLSFRRGEIRGLGTFTARPPRMRLPPGNRSPA